MNYRSFKWVALHPSSSMGCQTTICQSLRSGRMDWTLYQWSQIYFIKSAWNPEYQIFFSKPKLWPSSFAALCPARTHNTSFEISIFFLQQKILKKCVVALLRWFMWDQSNPILLHKMAFRWFWLELNVHTELHTSIPDPSHRKCINIFGRMSKVLKILQWLTVI